MSISLPAAAQDAMDAESRPLQAETYSCAAASSRQLRARIHAHEIAHTDSRNERSLLKEEGACNREIQREREREAVVRMVFGLNIMFNEHTSRGVQTPRRLRLADKCPWTQLRSEKGEALLRGWGAYSTVCFARAASETLESRLFIDNLLMAWQSTPTSGS